ncbi:MAG: hypothetical protein QXK69_02635 [Candidatus Caldarchaeum sp.]
MLSLSVKQYLESARFVERAGDPVVRLVGKDAFTNLLHNSSYLMSQTPMAGRETQTSSPLKTRTSTGQTPQAFTLTSIVPGPASDSGISSSLSRTPYILQRLKSR